MLGQETQWKTFGCGMMLLLVMGCFWGMLSATDGLAKKAKLKHTRAGQTAKLNLEAVGIGIASYEADRKELPPTDSPAVFKGALVPKYLTDATVLDDPGSGQPFTPNVNVKPDTKLSSFARRNVYLLAAPEPGKNGMFSVLLVSGEVREVSPPERLRLTIPPALPAPAPKPKPAGTPAPSPK